MPMFRLWAGMCEMSTPLSDDRPGVGALEPGGDAQRRGLPAPARAEQADQLARLDGEVEPSQRDRCRRTSCGSQL